MDLQGSKVDLVLARIRHDQILRRRVLWLSRLLVCGMIIAWTAIADAKHGVISPLAFVGGLAFLSGLLHALDYPDIVNYSDEVQSS